MTIKDYAKATRSPAKTPLTIVLRKLRDERGWSQSDLASTMLHTVKHPYKDEYEQVPYDHSYISRIESGARKPSREFIESAVVAFNLTANDPDYEALYLSAGFVPYAHMVDINITVYRLSSRLAEIDPKERAAVEKTLELILKGLS